MSLKLKALGLGLLAAMAVSAVAVVNASATAGGHFASNAGVTHVHVQGFVDNENVGPHTLHLSADPFDQDSRIGCTTQTHTGTTTVEKPTSITITPTYSNCHTTINKQAVTVHVNGCTYTFTVKAGPPETTEHTVHLLCPPGKTIEVTHPNCKVEIHAQTPTGKLTYTTTGTGNGHEITMDVDVTFDVTTHGLCQFVNPTNDQGILRGSVTVKGFNTVGQQIPITAT